MFLIVKKKKYSVKLISESGSRQGQGPPCLRSRSISSHFTPSVAALEISLHHDKNVESDCSAFT